MTLKTGITKKIHFNNFSFSLSLGSKEMNMGNSIPNDGVYEPWVTKYLKITSGFYGEDKDAIDIGANIGIITLILSKLQSKAKVFAFEPLSVMYEHLNLNLKKNNIKNVIAQKLIVSNKDNEIRTLNVPAKGDVGGSYVSDKNEIRFSVHKEEVKTLTLDTYLKETQFEFDIKIIKIDVECWEKYVLDGARKTIEKYQAVVFIEFNVQNRSIEIENRGKELFDEMRSLFDNIFLIDRLTEKLIQVNSYSDLRGAILTGHFVEDLICFNDSAFLDYLKPHIANSVYSSYNAAKTIITENQKGIITSLSHYPDNWCHGHDYFFQIKNEFLTHVKLTLQNLGPYPINRILLYHNNEYEEITLKSGLCSRIYSFNPNEISSLYLFVEHTFLAKEFINPQDPRTLGIKIGLQESCDKESLTKNLFKQNLTLKMKGLARQLFKKKPSHQPPHLIGQAYSNKKNEESVQLVERKLESKAFPLSELAVTLNKFPVKVLWRKSFYADYNSLFDSFYSFCRVGQKFISLHGEMNIETFHKRRKKESKLAHLYKCEYELTDDGLVQIQKKLIGLGADPRMVSNGKNAYAYVVGYGEAKHPAFLYVEKDDSLHPIKAKNDFDWGKNWQPYLKNNRLFIVHELTPYSVYEIDLDTYQLEHTYFSESNFSLPAHYTNHTMFRGGSNALVENETVYGIGRASAAPYKHLPFFWSSFKNETPIIQFISFFNKLSNKGFGIIDPTSFFKQDENLFLGLTCSETTWFHGQQFLNLLLVLDTENKYPQLPTLENILSKYESVTVNQKPNLRKHIFNCDQMQHDIPFSYEYGIKSTGEAGVLIYGPYLQIEEKLDLVVELSYLTTQKDGSIAGTFDIYLSKKKENGKVKFIKYSECDLKTTDNEIEKATLTFSTHKFIGYNLEFRVTVKNGYELNAFHIRTKKTTEIPIVYL